MSKKLISALLVLFMVLNLIAGFPVMAEETAGGTAEAISAQKMSLLPKRSSRMMRLRRFTLMKNRLPYRKNRPQPVI